MRHRLTITELPQPIAPPPGSPPGTAPTVPRPITIEDLRRELNLGDVTDHDLSLAEHIMEATHQLETATARVLLATRVRESYDTTPDDLYANTLQLHRAPVISVDAITYLDPAGETHYWQTDQYLTDLTEPCRIILAPTGVIPSVATDRLNAFSIDYLAGYGLAQEDMPPLVLEYLRNAVRIRFERRAPTELETQRQTAIVNALSYDL